MNQNFGIYTDLYNSVINDLESGKFLPNLKAIRKQIADAKKTIRVLVKGAAFCQNMEMLAKTERRIQLAKQKRDAMVAIMEYINEKMRYKKTMRTEYVLEKFSEMMISQMEKMKASSRKKGWLTKSQK